MHHAIDEQSAFIAACCKKVESLAASGMFDAPGDLTISTNRQ
jgi:hypothetical protein